MTLNSKIFKASYQCNIFGEMEEITPIKGILEQKFLIPPFSVLDCKQGYWQDRKRKWCELGIKSELGRNAQSYHMKNWTDKKSESGDLSGNKLPSDTSIFDPVLCEVCYKWFNVENGIIYDPFAGGSVRGIVANLLNYNYIGIDLSEQQIEANINNAQELNCNFNNLKWINDDSMNADKYLKNESVDMIFTCPPYYDLEIYSNKPNDLSNMNFENFVENYSLILQNAFKKLKNNRFGIVVIGDVRDKKGKYRNLIDITKNAIINDNICFYNDIILLTSLASASLRAEQQMSCSRKVVKIHQNVLVFYKGNPSEIRNNYKSLNFDY